MQNIIKVVATAAEDEKVISVPQIVLAEWWRGWSKAIQMIWSACATSFPLSKGSRKSDGWIEAT